MNIPSNSNPFVGGASGAMSPTEMAMGSGTTTDLSTMQSSIAGLASQAASPQQALQMQAQLAQFTTQMDEDSSLIEALSQAAQNAAKNAA